MANSNGSKSVRIPHDMYNIIMSYKRPHQAFAGVLEDILHAHTMLVDEKAALQEMVDEYYKRYGGL